MDKNFESVVESPAEDNHTITKENTHEDQSSDNDFQIEITSQK